MTYEPTDAMVEAACRVMWPAWDASEAVWWDPARIRMRAALIAAKKAELPLPRYRHVKRGTEYEVLECGATLQTATGDLADGSQMMVYRGPDGKVWVREVGEFHDGRFVEVQPASEEP
jgi:hypothetical protein